VILGITGLAGSGKSTLCNLMRPYGFHHISADSIGHIVLEEKSVQQELQVAFGDDVVIDGEVQRKNLAKRAFIDRAQTEKINSILHPKIRTKILRTLSEHSDDQVDTTLEAALLCETGLVELCDRSIFMTCPFESRLERVKSRGWDERELKNRDAQQDERLKADATDICWESPQDLGSLQRFSLILDITFRYERACSSKEKASWILQQTISK